MKTELSKLPVGITDKEKDRKVLSIINRLKTIYNGLLTGNFDAQSNAVLGEVKPGTIGMLGKKINKLLYYREMAHKPSAEWDMDDVEHRLV